MAFYMLLSDSISIHSTTRVETHGFFGLWATGSYFNPLHHEGGDFWRRLYQIPGADFNPLHHEGGDRNARRASGFEVDFNPLHHEGGDGNQGPACI